MTTTRDSATADRSIGWLIRLGLVVGSAFTASLLAPTGVQAQSGNAGGAELYAQHCASCHQPSGEGVEGAFPPLLGNPAVADSDYVRNIVVNGQSGPIEVLGVGYDGEMPPVVLLEGAELDAVIAYVVSLAGAGGSQDADADADVDSASEPEPVDEPLAPDADRGHDLFIGSNRLENGGAPCAGCHTAGSVGNLGGYSLGPDLTASFDRLGGEAGLNGWLANPPSATMAPIFADKPMTEGEVGDLIAYLATTPAAEPNDQSVDRLLVAAIGGVIVLFSVLALIWRGTRQTYVERLRSRR